MKNKKQNTQMYQLLFIGIVLAIFSFSLISNKNTEQVITGYTSHEACVQTCLSGFISCVDGCDRNVCIHSNPSSASFTPWHGVQACIACTNTCKQENLKGKNSCEASCTSQPPTTGPDLTVDIRGWYEESNTGSINPTNELTQTYLENPIYLHFSVNNIENADSQFEIVSYWIELTRPDGTKKSVFTDTFGIGLMHAGTSANKVQRFDRSQFNEIGTYCVKDITIDPKAEENEVNELNNVIKNGKCISVPEIRRLGPDLEIYRLTKFPDALQIEFINRLNDGICLSVYTTTPSLSLLRYGDKYYGGRYYHSTNTLLCNSRLNERTVYNIGGESVINSEVFTPAIVESQRFKICDSTICSADVQIQVTNPIFSLLSITKMANGDVEFKYNKNYQHNALLYKKNPDGTYEEVTQWDQWVDPWFTDKTGAEITFTKTANELQAAGVTINVGDVFRLKHKHQDSVVTGDVTVEVYPDLVVETMNSGFTFGGTGSVLSSATVTDITFNNVFIKNGGVALARGPTKIKAKVVYNQLGTDGSVQATSDFIPEKTFDIPDINLATNELYTVTFAPEDKKNFDQAGQYCLHITIDPDNTIIEDVAGEANNVQPSVGCITVQPVIFELISATELVNDDVAVKYKMNFNIQAHLYRKISEGNYEPIAITNVAFADASGTAKLVQIRALDLPAGVTINVGDVLQLRHGNLGSVRTGDVTVQAAVLDLVDALRLSDGSFVLSYKKTFDVPVSLSRKQGTNEFTISGSEAWFTDSSGQLATITKSASEIPGVMEEDRLIPDAGSIRQEAIVKRPVLDLHLLKLSDGSVVFEYKKNFNAPVRLYKKVGTDYQPVAGADSWFSDSSGLQITSTKTANELQAAGVTINVGDVFRLKHKHQDSVVTGDVTVDVLN